ncbi:MAG TPA: amino acid adenylation domain-containing protein [Candidatus Acidoferrales bacterium]|nr:amino acid adenylation domain-containing protein [Candidatus Acidoferrales bacterium]
MAILTNLSGAALSTAESSTTFLELGFDSLFLAQVSIALQKQFGVKVTFRQLLNDFSSAERLAAHLDGVLPRDVSKGEKPAAREDGPLQATPNREQALPASDAPVDSQPTRSPLQTLMQEQLRAMNELFAKQLEAMEKSGEDGNPRTALRQKSADVAQPTPACTPSVASAPDASRREQVAVEKAFTPHHPPATKHAGEWSNSQRAYLSKLIERYTKRTARSKALTQQYRRVLADPRVVSGFRPEWKEMVYPIVTIRSEGSHLWDVDGNEYIDLLNGFGPIFFGHRPESIERAVAEQLHQGFEIGPQSQLAGEVAALFCELTGNERMTFCNTGSEAVMAALRVSRTVTGRSKVVVFAGAYHGMFDEVLITQASGGSSVGALPIAPGIPQENLSNMVVLEYGSASALDWIRQHASELAAVLVEPVQSRHPALQPVEFLKELRGITAASGTALIFDEVVTGFRVHPGGCQALFGIRADLATYGKVLAGGLPIGVLAGRAEFMNALDGGPWQFGDDSYPEANVTFFAGTFVRHPLALAAAKATLGQLKSAGPKLQEDLARRTTRLAAALRATFEQQLIPAQIEDFTSLFYMQFPREFPYGSLLYYALREKGIYILEGFPSFLTTAHSGQDVARIEEGFSQAAEEMRAAGFYSKAKAPSPRLVMASKRPTEPQTVEVALTEAQMEILLAAQMSDGASCAFNESFTIRLCGTLDRSAFETALGELFARHDALRASISTEAQMLRFAKQVELPLRFQNLSGLSRSHADAAIADAVRSDALLPFDLAKPPLVRMTLFQLSATEHALLFTAHHVVCDGWSSNVLLGELATLYSAQISGDASELSPALQFSEYALRQAATRAKTEDREFWMAQFRDLVPVLELPTDRSRPVVKSFAGATARSDIERTLLERIKRASTSQGCTLFAALLAAFGALLHRLTSQDDIAIGIPFAGQSNLSECNLVGHCVNFLPIRMRWFEADTAADALQRVQRSLLDAQEHQDFTYGTLVRERNVPRQPGRLPLIEVQFNLEKIGDGLSFHGLQAEIETNPKAAVNFDLFLNAVETKNGLRLECDYNSDLFDERTIERWLSHYAVLLEGMASDQNQPISAQPLLTEAQRKHLISEWNATERDFPLDLRVYELFQTQAARTPEKIAVSGKGGALTYQQLEERSNQLARHLLKIGLQPSDLIGVALDRSINMLVTLLAVWKAGVAYVPLDPAYPQERIAFILEDASVPILITTSDLIERLPVCDARLVCLDRDSILIEREAASSPDPVANTQPLAYVIYTSGSTGRPKGVAVTQRNLVNLLLAMQLEPGITPEDRLLAVTTLSFDIAALELFLPIVSGAQVVLAAREDAADGRALRRLIQNENITMLQATPATWRLLLEAGWPEEHRLKMLCGGEALSRDLADALLPHGELWNMYGPTETTVWSAVSRVTRGTGSIPLGHPIANTQFYVLDSHQQLLPLGVAGELCIGGEGVAQGYFHRPDLTEKVFLPDPFHPNGQHRIYRTGDTVRCHADGTLEFLGRSDQQVKIRGFRVELQEVEAALNRHPGIRQAVAAGCNDEHGFKKLVAYVVPERPPEAPDPSELREWLRGHLPTYMIPSQYIFLDALPHTPNGKVDRKSLPHPEDAARLTDEFVPPRTPLEAQIASLCATVMQVDRIGVTTSLLDLGADSLHLFQIASRAAAAGLPVTAEQIMRLHTVEALAKEIGRTKESDSSFGALPPLAPAAREQFRVASAD